MRQKHTTMLHSTEIHCPHCQSNNLVKQGKIAKGQQKWQCNSCKKYFQFVHLQSVGSRDERKNNSDDAQQQRRSRYRQSVAHKQEYGLRSIIKTLKNNPYFLMNDETGRCSKLEVEIRFLAELDEFWSFVQNKGNQRWTWYAIERRSGIILAWHNGKQSKTAIFDEFNGLIAEQFVLQQLAKHTVFYWTGTKLSEVDFVMQYGSKIVPIEVKSGTNVKAKSLKLFRETYSPQVSIRFSMKNTRLENDLLNIPLYSAFLCENLLNYSFRKCVQRPKYSYRKTDLPETLYIN